MTHRRRPMILAALAIAAALFAPASAAALDARAADDPANSTARTRVYEQLASQIESAGNAEAIITLDVDLTPEGELDDGERHAQRERIVAAITTFVDDLDHDGIEVRRRFTTFAGIAVTLDAAGLDAVAEHDGDIRTIEFDQVAVAHGDADTELLYAPQVWDKGYRGAGGAIAIIDTGVDAADDRFSDGEDGTRVVAEACFSKHCPNGESEMVGPGAADPFLSVLFGDHGTKVAAVAAGAAGMAPQADIVAVNMSHISSGLLSPCPEGQPCTVISTSGMISTLEWIVDVHADHDITTVNVSGGLDDLHPGLCLDSALREPAKHLRSAGVTVVASSGNAHDKSGVDVPACIPEVFSVGATVGDSLETLEVAGYSNSAIGLDFVGPTNGHTGTSFSTPHVSGAFHLLLTAFPESTATEVSVVLSETGFPVTDINGVTAPIPQLGAAFQLLARIDGQCSTDPATGVPCDDDGPRPEPDDPDLDCSKEPFVFEGDKISPNSEGITVIVATPCDDIIYGTAGPDQIFATQGDDIIHGYDGDDIITPGTGNDTVYAGTGNDTVIGGYGNDHIEGGPGGGADHLEGGQGKDTIAGGDGNDTLSGGWGADSIQGGIGHDIIEGGGHPDEIRGGPGDDTIYSGSHNDSAYGGPGDDTILGENGNDHLEGNEGSDTIWAGPGTDTVEITEDEDNQLLPGLSDADIAYGGTGHDLVWAHLVDPIFDFEWAHLELP